MPRRASSAMPLLVTLDPSSGTTRYRQIFDAIREAILGGRLAPGAQLPSTRVLAAELGVARSTAVVAYEQLAAEGYLSGARGSGTYVARNLPDSLRVPRRPSTPAGHAPSGSRSLSARARYYATSTAGDAFAKGTPRAFRLGEPSLDAFPVKVWRQLHHRRWRADSRAFLGYGDPGGFRPLRQAIAEYVRGARGVEASADQVVLVRGTQQGLDLAARVLLDPGDSVWVEDPGYRSTHAILAGAGCRIEPVPVDGEGLVVSEGERRSPDARAAFVAPSHQYPLGVTMSLARRLELLEWARRRGAWIVEDDFDSEFRYAGQPQLALQGLGTDDRVIYLGTFSKTLFPALRLGYMVVPRDTVEAFRTGRTLTDYLSPTVEQAVLADFLIEGHFARHARRMRTLYAARQEALLQAAARHLEDLVRIEPSDTGMHVIGWLREDIDERGASAAALEADVDVAPLTRYCLEAKHPPALLFGYSAVDESTIAAATRRLRDALLSVTSDGRTDPLTSSTRVGPSSR